MRTRILAAVAAAAVALGVVGCGREQPAQTEAPAAEAPAATTTAEYDLSPEANERFLADYAMKEGVMTHPSGLMYRVLKAGDGAMPTSGNDQVTVTYKGWMIDGTVFDETQPGMPATFQAGGLIEGWVHALSMMREGDEWEIVLPSPIAYGEQGAGGVIPPNQTLVFQMALLDVVPAQ